MKTISVIKGDGISSEVIDATLEVFQKAGVKLNYETCFAGEKVFNETGTPLPQTVIDSISKNKVALKGPITTPIATGFRSVNVTLRKHFDLYCNLRPTKTFDGIATKFENIDLVVVRENTEDLYMGVENFVSNDRAESIKIFTRQGCTRILKWAFDFAKDQNRKKVTVVHKANIMKATDGMFLNIAREMSTLYPEIVFEEMIVDAMAMHLVMNPQDYDVLVMPNLYGDILSDLCAGLVGGLGLAPSANIGKEIAVFEPIHGSAPDIAGKGIANPTATILAGVLLLRHLNLFEEALKIETAVEAVLRSRKFLTADLGGVATTKQFVDAVCAQF